LKDTFEPLQAERLARLLARIYKDIANTVTKEEFKELTEVVKRLGERIDRLAEAQEKTEQRVNELAEAQRKTEESLNKLIKRVDLIEKRLEVVEERLEGVSNSVGYSLENSAYKALPSLLKKEGIEVSGRLIRRYWQENQINIWGKGRQKGKEIIILGEAKVRPSKKEIERFLRIAEEIKRKEKKEAYLLFVAHDFPPAIEELLKKKGIRYYWSYEF